MVDPSSMNFFRRLIRNVYRKLTTLSMDNVWDDPDMDVTPQCELIWLARCSYYRISSNGQESPKSLELMRRIDNI